MAESKKNAVAAQEPEEREDIFIPRGDSRDDPNLFVSVNGVNYLLPKGKKSNVPKHIADEIRRGWEAEEMLARKRERYFIKEEK